MPATPEPPALVRALGLIRAGRRDEAEALCRTRLEQAPEDVDALQLLGVIAGMSGNFANARQLLERANELRPRHPDILDNLAMACRENGDPAAAAMHSRAAVTAAPSRTASWYGLALAQRRLGEWHDAMESYRRVTSLDPKHADAWANLAYLSESTNLLDEAEDASRRALALDPGNVMAALAAAQVAIRKEDFAAARDRLEALLERGDLPAKNETIARQRLGLALDRLDAPAAAFEQFTISNRRLARQHDAVFRMGAGPLGLTAVRRFREFVTNLKPGEWQPREPDDGYPDPLFLMGFPRSGTTLTDRILDRHPALATLEERDTLVDLQRDFALTVDGPKRLRTINAPTQEAYRQAYRRRVADWIEPAPGVRVIDKLPLHTISLPMIAAVFPNARIVFVVRDPRDVCLSCFMQSFELNVAMAHFLDLELTAEYYCEVMTLGLAALERLPVTALTLRYEALVETPERVCRELLEFLEVDWNPDVLSWHEAQTGRQIETPSYRQVTRPMYRTAIGRWRRYEDQLAPVLERLSPFVERLGYS